MTEPTTATAAHIGAAMRSFRKRRDATLDQVSAGSGLSVAHLSGAERGLHGISVESIERVAVALHASLVDLFVEAERLATSASTSTSTTGPHSANREAESPAELAS